MAPGIRTMACSCGSRTSSRTNASPAWRRRCKSSTDSQGMSSTTGSSGPAQEDGALTGVATDGRLGDFEPQGIEDGQAADQGGAEPEDQLEHLQGLQAAEDARQHAQDA